MRSKILIILLILQGCTTTITPKGNLRIKFDPPLKADTTKSQTGATVR